MEQYVHTLIAAKSAYVPKPSQVAEFFDGLVKCSDFHIISEKRFQPGLRVMKPSGRFRQFVSPLTGETKSFSISDIVKLEKITDIPAAIEGLEDCSVLLSGAWKVEKQPLAFLTTAGAPFGGDPVCEVSCHLRTGLVSTSCCDAEVSHCQNLPSFGAPCNSEDEVGIFSHPWTGAIIQVPNAGCARFWIEFEFGKFLLPKMADDLNILSPSIVAKAEECFQTRFVQGCRFN